MTLEIRFRNVFYIYQFSLIWIFFMIVFPILGSNKDLPPTYIIIAFYLLLLYFPVFYLNILRKFYGMDKLKKIVISDRIEFYNNEILIGSFSLQEIKSIVYYKPLTFKIGDIYKLSFTLPNGENYTITSIMFKNSDEFELFCNYFPQDVFKPMYVKLDKILIDN